MTRPELEAFLNDAGDLGNLEHRRRAFAYHNELHPDQPLSCLSRCQGEVDLVLTRLYAHIGIARRQNTVPKLTRRERLAACKACPYLVPGPMTCGELLTGRDVMAGTATNLCGCFVRLKTYLTSERCPTGRW